MRSIRYPARMPAGISVQRAAPAKINLALAVGPPYEEGPSAGMHPIASWMVPIDLADALTITQLEDDRLSRYAIDWSADAPQPNVPIDWPITDDLTVRAHKALEAHAGRSLPVQLRLEKRIPVGAGLGGGSSNAAAMLLALDELFALNTNPLEIRAIAHTLGSDIPFFLADPGSSSAASPALVKDLGETLEPAPNPNAHIVLILPSFTCPTGPVYHSFDEQFDDLEDPDDHPGIDAMRLDQLRAATSASPLTHDHLFNDLAAPAERIQPKLASLRTRIEHAIGTTPHVTGSGAACFIVCSGGRVEAELLAQQLDQFLQDATAIPASTI